jgi:hypothetical protein
MIKTRPVYMENTICWPPKRPLHGNQQDWAGEKWTSVFKDSASKQVKHALAQPTGKDSNTTTYETKTTRCNG